MTLLSLFFSFLKIGAFSFGGGYAAMPLIQNEVVTLHGWMSMSAFGDLVTLSQMTPGPIAINSATFVGLQIAGIQGAVCATLGCVLPSCVLSLVIARLYLKYRKLDLLQNVLGSLRPAVVALIASAGLSILMSSLWGETARILRNVRVLSAVLFAASFCLLRRFHWNPILVMLLAGAANVLVTLVSQLPAA